MKNLGILVIDMQPEFIERDLYKQENLIEKQIKLIEFAKDKNISVFALEYIYCKKTIEQLKNPLINANALFIEKYNDDAFIIAKNPMTEDNHVYIYSLSPIILNHYFKEIKFCYEKHVRESNLNKLLKNNNIKNLILTGVHKDSCVLETATGAKKRGYNIITSEELIDKKGDSINDWYMQNTNYLNSLNEIFNFIQTSNFINN